MRLLQSRGHDTFTLTEFFHTIPPYAILSHTWGPDSSEVTFKDIIKCKGQSKSGYEKLRFCAQQAAKDGLEYFWVDTCCIDKSSSAELSEAINSMFRWYARAEKCYVLCEDVLCREEVLAQLKWKIIDERIHGDDDGKSDSREEFSYANNVLSLALKGASLEHSRWFTRGWTLQELIAPHTVEFFSKNGTPLGTKLSLQPLITRVTGIQAQVLQGCALSSISVEERLSWAKLRQTKREEDAAYSLMGLFDIHMPLIYGEGKERAFRRLQREIEDMHEGPTLAAMVRSALEFSPQRWAYNLATQISHLPRSELYYYIAIGFLAGILVEIADWIRSYFYAIFISLLFDNARIYYTGTITPRHAVSIMTRMSVHHVLRFYDHEVAFRIFRLLSINGRWLGSWIEVLLPG